MMTSYLIATSLLIIPFVTAQHGISFVGVGYNLLTGNPDGGLSAHGGVDPGLLYTRKIMEISPGNNPPEVVMEQRHSCAHVQENHVFYGTKSYQDKLSLGVKPTGNVVAGIVNFAFSLSGRYAQTHNSTRLKHDVFLDNQTVCNLGRARYAEELAAYRGFSVTPNFAAAVCRLPVSYDAKKYMDFFDNWGTHVTTQVELGTKRIQRFKTSLSQFVEHVRKEGGVGVSLGGSYMGYGASLDVDFSKFKSSDIYKQKFGTYQYSLEAGTPQLPEPIGVTVVSMDMALNSKYWSKHDASLLQSLHCPDVNSLASRTGNIVKALNAYAAYKMAHQPTDPPLKIPITWPQGTYGLMKPKTGCPGGHMGWYEGYRYEDFEDFFNHNKVSPNLHLAGSFDDENMKFEFCMKGDVKKTDYDMVWPAGDYCILKYGDCPTGFSMGWIYWNDEQHENHNSVAGAVPDGVYNDNTKIFYCCRDDAMPTHNVAMPAGKPFYLIRYKRGCQQVFGMNVAEEFVEADVEDIWGKSHDAGGAHPFIDGSRNPRMHFCYYTPKMVAPIIG